MRMKLNHFTTMNEYKSQEENSCPLCRVRFSEIITKSNSTAVDDREQKNPESFDFTGFEDAEEKEEQTRFQTALEAIHSTLIPPEQLPICGICWYVVRSNGMFF